MILNTGTQSLGSQPFDKVDPIHMGWFRWLFVFLFFHNSTCQLNSSSSTLDPPPPLCHPHDSSALLSFKHSFPFINATTYYSSNYNTTVSWETHRDCCSWSGVTCDDVTGRVIGLHLMCGGLQGVIDSNSSLFTLSHLQTLNLSRNDFKGSEISPNFGRFPSLIHLDLSYCSFSGHVPLELAFLSNLLTLDLKMNYELQAETSSLKRIVANLTSLTKLRLSSVNMSDVSPNSLMNLSTSLTILDLRECGLKGQFPENVLRLPNLELLDLSFISDLTGSVPQQNWTSPLKMLGLSETRFPIDLPYLTRTLKYLTELFVRNCSLVGSFPASLGNLTKITSLDISSNSLGGQIPWLSFNLDKLTYLALSENNFVGQLPEICSNSSSSSSEKTSLWDTSTYQRVGPLPLNLKSLRLEDNFLNGTIPSWLYSLPSLQRLDLSYNQFTGHIGEFHNTNLIDLDLNSNKLCGPFPRSLFQQENLFFVDLSSNNLNGVVVLEQFSKFRNLYYLSLSYNSLSVISTPRTSHTLSPTLSSLELSSCNITKFPNSLRNLNALSWLNLSNNKIEGSVPTWLWNVGRHTLFFLNISHNSLEHMGPIQWKNLEYIDLRSNRLQGRLPIPPPSTIFFSVSNNQLVGKIISSSICNLSFIEVLDLSNNSLSGKIPSCHGSLSNFLSVLDLRMNKFVGEIPSAFSKGSSLRTLNLNGNQLEGPLPQSLINCKKLEVLDVGNNKMNGSFPFWLESLPELQVLILSANNFSGIINDPNTRHAFQKLRIIDISNNKFEGSLPAKYFENFVAMMDTHISKLEYMEKGYYQDSVTVVMKGNELKLEKIQKMIRTIDFSDNNFTGVIPELIGKLRSLKGLNFSHNQLSGVIPASLGNLTNLEALDLSSNELLQNIPPQLASDLLQLQVLNLSNNKLEGPIPHGPQFNTFTPDSYRGNSQLCGFPLLKSCTEEEKPRDKSGHDDEEYNNGIFLDLRAVMMGCASGLVIGVSVGYMVFFGGRFDYWLTERLGRATRQKKNAHSRIRRRST